VRFSPRRRSTADLGDRRVYRFSWTTFKGFGLEVEAVIEASVAAELLIAAELPVDGRVAGLSAPGLVVASPDGHGAGPSMPHAPAETTATSRPARSAAKSAAMLAKPRHAELPRGGYMRRR
jgi:hypothetical protein